MKKTFGKVRGNWKAMTARQMLESSEIMLDAAKVQNINVESFIGSLIVIFMLNVNNEGVL